MSIYVISDLHLSFDEDKPMDVFGENWKDHKEKIEENWKNTVNKEDLVLLPGDFCWSMHLKDSYKAFKYIEELPGKKLLLKGNHDYWWNTVTSMRKFLEENNIENVDFIYNNSYEYENYVICGTRGWNVDAGDEESKKILKREEERLKLSLDSAIAKYGKEKEIILCMHYPPIKEKEETEFLKIMKQYNVKKCYYGHLHGVEQKNVIEGMIENIEFKMVSCDYTNFNLIKVK